MIAKKCDRCGAFYDLYNVERNKEKINGVAPLNTDESGRYCWHEYIDLCPDCKDSFERWLKGSKRYQKERG